MSVPSNLIPTRITQLPVAPTADENSLMMIVYQGNNYQIRVGDLLSVAGVPTTRQVIAGTGMTGGGQLSSNVTLSIAPGGVGSTELASSGVTPGSYGTATDIPVFTVDATGRVMSATTVPATFSGYVPDSRQVNTGAGLSGGGALTSNLTITVNLSSATPLAGFQSGSAGVSTDISRADHKHPAVNLGVDDEVDGILGLGNGGTARSIVADAGAIIWSGADGLYVGPVGLAGQVLVSSGTSAPTWGSALTISDQAANLVYAGPAAGAAAPTGFRTLVAADLPNSGASAGTYGAAATVPVFTVNAKGQITAVTNTTIAISTSQITSGTLGVDRGGTGASSLTANGILYGNGTSAVGVSSAGVTGEVLVGNTGSAPTWGALSSNAVTSFSGGTTGLTPSSATQGVVTLAGTLAVANGGTGLTTTPANGQIDIGNGTGFSRATLTAGSGVTITDGAGSVTINATGLGGTVTSVDVSGGTTGLTTSGGPITTSGTITLAGTLAAANGGTGQSSYTIGDLLYASGATALSKLADIATGNALISGGVATAPSWGKIGLTTHVSGTLPVTNGGTGTATAFTAGSVVFAGASGVYAQDNASLFWDDTNDRLGIGTSSPAYKLDINAITGWAANQTAPIANIVGANAPTNGGGNLRVLSNTSATADAGGSLVLGGYYTAQTNSIDFAEISGRKQTGQTTGGYLALSTRADLGNETERMRIDSSGNVGIGTSSPSSKLHVAGGTDSQIRNTATAGSSWFIGSNVSAYYLHNESNTPMLLTTNGTERMRIEAAGNVGIGTSSPSYQLTIQGTGQDTANLTDAGNKGGSLFLRATAVTSGSGGAVLFGTTFGNQTPFAAIKGLIANGTTNTVGDLAFSTRSAIADTSLTERMRLTFDGKMGIGTSSPDYLLTLQTGDAAISMKDSGGTTRAYIGVAGAFGSAPTGALRLRSDQGGLVYGFAGTEQLRIDTSGNVGIGTSSPSQKLEVFASANSLQIESVVRNDQAGTGVAAIGFNVSSSAAAETTSTKAGIGLVRSAAFGVGSICFYNNATASAGNFTTADERMRIDSSGNVGIGTSSPSTYGKFVVAGGDGNTQFNVGTNGVLRIAGYNSFWSGALLESVNTAQSAYLPIVVNGLHTVLATGGTERARISSSGYVSIGSTTTNGLLTVDGVGPTLVSQAFAYFAESGGAAVSGYASGQTVTNSIWASSRISGQEFDARSDGRLKKDVTPIPASDAWHFVQNVMPVHYKWINGPDNGHKFGFIAQDVVKAGFPNLIGQYSDSNVQEITDADGFTSPAGIALTVNYDQIVPLLASALRDALAQIDDLKSRLTVLEGKQ